MSEFKWKNTIGEGTKMFWKYQLSVWLSIQNLYWHFTFSNSQVRMFWSHCRVMVFNATFNNISVISWRSVLLVDETGENHRPAVSH